MHKAQLTPYLLRPTGPSRNMAPSLQCCRCLHAFMSSEWVMMEAPSLDRIEAARGIQRIYLGSYSAQCTSHHITSRGGCGLPAPQAGAASWQPPWNMCRTRGAGTAPGKHVALRRSWRKALVRWPPPPAIAQVGTQPWAGPRHEAAGGRGSTRTTCTGRFHTLVSRGLHPPQVCPHTKHAGARRPLHHLPAMPHCRALNGCHGALPRAGNGRPRPLQ